MRKFFTNNSISVLTVLFSFLVCFLLVAPVFADGGNDTGSIINLINVIAGVLGVSVFGLAGYIFDLRSVLKEFVDVVEAVKELVARYKDLPETKKLKKELLEALEILATKLRKRPFGQRLADRVQVMANQIRRL